MKTECGAFALANTLRAPFHKDSSAGLTRDARAIIKSLASLESTSANQVDVRAEMFMNRIARLKERGAETRQLLTLIMTASVLAQIKPDTTEKLDDLHVALQTIIPGQNIRTSSEITVDAIDRAGTDIRFYAERGVCGALDVQEFNLRD